MLRFQTRFCAKTKATQELQKYACYVVHKNIVYKFVIVDEIRNLVKLVYLRFNNLRENLRFLLVCQQARKICLSLQELFVYTAGVRGPFDVLFQQLLDFVLATSIKLQLQF